MAGKKSSIFLLCLRLKIQYSYRRLKIQFGRVQMQFRRSAKIVTLAILLTSFGCASFEPGLRYQDLSRPRQPTVKQTQEGLDISVEEFASANKSRQAFDADVAPNGILALLLKVENNGSQTYKIQEQVISAYLGSQSLSLIGGEKAASESANSEYAGKALGWTVAAGPFAILLWPVTIGASAAHTASTNRRIEQHFESLRFNDALLKPNQTAAGFLYFQLPSGVKRLETLRLEVIPSEENSANKLSFNLPLPNIDLSASVTDRVSNSAGSQNNPSNE
jgi:hypothetical protein